VTATAVGAAGRTLRTGVPVLVQHRPGAPVTTVTVWLLTGSRDEQAAFGVTHLLEHVLMQAELPGRGVRPVDAIEALGGEANAVTSREHLMMYARVPTAEAAAAADLLAASLTNPELPADVVAAERRVVCEELRLAASEPDDIVHDVFFAAAFGDHPLGRPVGGTIAAVSRLRPADLHAHRAEHVHAGRVAVVVAGGLPAEEAFRLFDAGPLGDLPAGPPPTPGPPPPVVTAGRADLPLNSDSAAVLLGGAAARLGDRRHAAYHVLMELVAGGNAALLVEEIRSRRGLSYDVWGHPTGYRDTGVWRVGFTTAPEAADEVVSLAVRLLGAQLDRGWAEPEVVAARRRVAGLVQLDLESSLEEATLLGDYALVGGDPEWTLRRHLDELEAVGAADIAACAADLLDGLVVATAGGSGSEAGPGVGNGAGADPAARLAAGPDAGTARRPVPGPERR
jgi:predicted Zn-dependent peptidase